MSRVLLLVALCSAASASAQAPDSRFSAGGYYRIMARPDFQGGVGRLGFWNLSGRLMNEGPWAALEMKLELLQAPPGSAETWASLHARLEGGSVNTADSGNGSLANFRLSQLYARVGNVLLEGVTWQLGTLAYYFGDLGLYDMRPAQVLEDTIGVSARWESRRVDLLLAAGDSGFAVRGAKYVPLLTAGGALRARFGESFELGVGGQYAYEPFIDGNRNSSYVTPDVVYEDYLRGEVLQKFLLAHPNDFERFQRPVPAKTPNTSWRGVAYLGFGKLGPLAWNNLFARVQRLHPLQSYVDSDGARSVTVYTADLTRDRTSVVVGDEVQLRLVPDRFELVLAGLYGTDVDLANTLSASEANREYLSTVVRGQVSLSRTVHLLVESSVAFERSLNGRLYRSSADSIFENNGQFADSRGLQYGDSPTRTTVQVKAGVVLNPTGPGVYARPSIRLLYGTQYSTMHAAFGNAFVDRADQFDVFKPKGTISWHHLISLESEGWF